MSFCADPEQYVVSQDRHPENLKYFLAIYSNPQVCHGIYNELCKKYEEPETGDIEFPEHIRELVKWMAVRIVPELDRPEREARGQGAGSLDNLPNERARDFWKPLLELGEVLNLHPDLENLFYTFTTPAQFFRVTVPYGLPEQACSKDAAMRSIYHNHRCKQARLSPRSSSPSKNTLQHHAITAPRPCPRKKDGLLAHSSRTEQNPLEAIKTQTEPFTKSP